MDKIIENSTVFGYLQQNKVIKAEGSIRCLNLKTEFNLIGFLPYCDNCPLAFVDLNNHMKVTPYLIQFKDLSIRLNVMKYVKIESKDRIYLSENNILPVKEVVQITKNTQKDIGWAYKKSIESNDERATKKLIEVLKDVADVDFLSVDENNHVYYNPDNYPLVFYRDKDNKKIVANTFLCLCSYSNPVTGLISYAAYPPEECIMSIPNDSSSIPEHPDRVL